MTNKRVILDVTCGTRTIWFNKDHPNAIYTDCRKEAPGFFAGRPNAEVKPHFIMDYKDLKFVDKTFKMVIWDPPHFLNLSKKSWIYKKYGSLDSSWKEELTKGFAECWRVLEDYGTLIFKWSAPENESKNRIVKISEVLKLFPVQPIVGHTTGNPGLKLCGCVF